MDLVIDWLQQYSAAIQTIATIALVILTFLYIRTTAKLAHAAHDCYIRPVKLNVIKDTDKPGWSVDVCNYGPNIALNVMVEAIAIKGKAPDESKPGWYWVDESFFKAEGPYEILPNEKNSFFIHYHVSFKKSPFYLKWKTLTGKINKSAWMIVPVGINEEIRPVFGIEKLKFKMKWVWTLIIITPLTFIKRKYHSRWNR